MSEPEPVDTAWIQDGAQWGARAATRAALGARMSAPAWRTALDQTGVTRGDTVLDLACGSGEFCALATERGAKATGIDASEEMLDLARKQAPEADFQRLPLGVLPWPDNTFDVVTAFNALFFAADPDEAFEEARRVSKRHTVVCEWHPNETSDLLTVGQAVRGPSGRRRAVLPEPDVAMTIDIPSEHESEDAMLRAMLSLGSYQRMIEKEGEQAVAERIKGAAAPFRTERGGYLFENKFLLLVFRK